MEALVVEPGFLAGLGLSVVGGFVFGGRDVPDSGVDAGGVELFRPFGGGQFHVGQAVPGAAGLDQLGLVQADR